MKPKTILISGAGVSGLTLAFWLKRSGFLPTLVERSADLCTGGYKVDIRGAALEVIRRMNLHDKIVKSHTDMQGATIVDEAGREVAEMSGDTFGYRVGEDLEIIRGDLCRILRDAAGDVEIIYGDFIKGLSQDTEAVQVEFDKNKPRSFDLIVGADGLHSAVRGIVFGEESRFSRELGLYIAIFSVPNVWNLDRWEIEFNDNGKLVNIYSSKGSEAAKAAFIFASKPLQFDPRDVSQQKRLLSEAYAGVNWEVPRLLKTMEEAADFYFDAVEQIFMDKWSDGRVVLVGDAGYCASPTSGQGTSLALVGAYVLAKELEHKREDYIQAFSRYERRLRKFVAMNQKLGLTFARQMTDENKIVNWLKRILPGELTKFMTNRAVRRVNQAANAIKI